MQKMIIVEGIDGSGKTTLCRALGDLLNLQVHHSSKERDRQAMERNMEQALQDPVAKIWDRIHAISEIVYGPILRGGALINGEYWRHQVRQQDPLIIYCRVPIAYVHSSGPSEFETLEHFQAAQAKRRAIYDLYDRIMLGYAPILYDYTASPYNRVYEMALAWRNS
jgi:shikimate kinase